MKLSKLFGTGFTAETKLGTRTKNIFVMCSHVPDCLLRSPKARYKFLTATVDLFDLELELDR